MRNRLKKSTRHDSVSSTKSNNRRSHDGKADSSHRRTPSTPAPAPADAPPGSAGSMTTTNNSRGGAATTTASPSTSSLSPLSSSQLNSGATASHLSRTLSTIRAVTGFDDKPDKPEKPPQPSIDDESSSADSPSVTQHSQSAFSSSVNSNGSGASFSSHNGVSQNGQPNDANTKSQLSVGKSRAAAASSTAAPPHLAVPESTGGKVLQRKSSGGFGIPAGASSGARAVFAAAATTGGGEGLPADDENGGGAWDSTIGKAGLGKTGRVINKLVSDNEALKRDLQIERLKADEARQAARLLEDKMERMVSDYETRLLEANVNKTLLARKERQVESLQGAVELEKKRTADAQAREQSWRAEMDKVRAETKRQVEEAATQVALVEGRYEAIRSHWREQGADVRRAADRMGAEVRALAAARRDDDDKINRLRELCDQQDGNIRGLQAQKEALAAQFAAYKAEQERLLHDLKTNGAAREAEQERMLAETQEVLNKLKWALKIKETIPWAE